MIDNRTHIQLQDHCPACDNVSLIHNRRTDKVFCAHFHENGIGCFFGWNTSTENITLEQFIRDYRQRTVSVPVKLKTIGDSHYDRKSKIQ